MQRFYAFVIFIITATLTQAQINEVPLTYNPILQKLHAEKQQEIQQLLQKKMQSKYGNAAITRDPFIEFGTCLLEGENIEICTDTTNLGNGTTFNILDASALTFGTIAIDSTCVTYTANNNVGFGIDSLKTEVCPGGDMTNCDTVIYPIYVHRDNNITTLATTVINAEDTITICVDSSPLPGDLSSATILNNNTTLGDAFPFGDCIFYDATKFGGTDVVTFELCDDFCICDVYEIPIQIIQDTLELPFMDDFSYDGPRPNDNWLNQDVFVNNTMAINPVSVGVATFDGLDGNGAPHGGGYGVSDDLTSAFLDLSPFNAASNVYLSFYVQPQGLGEAPVDGDSLILEFKDNTNNWILIDTFKAENLPSDVFTFSSYHINQNKYFFKGFQFRFRNFSNRTGNIDHWHLDYVRLRDNLDGSPILADIAFTEVPNPILGTYTSMPWWHFFANIAGEIPPSNEFNEIHLYSHDEVDRAFTPSEVEIIEMETGNVLVSGQNLISGAVNIAPGLFPDIFPPQVPNVFTSFENSINNDFPANLKKLEFSKTYSFSIAAENPNVDPIVADNNEVTHTTLFDNYFAYDDGTAEGGFEATKDDVQIALKFHTNVDDSLKAIQFHFPHIKVDASNQSFNLRVWIGTLDDTPEYEGLFKKPLYIDSYTDSLNGFTTYVLDDLLTGERTPLFIPAGDFYVGWQQVSDCALNECIAVGTDKNNPDGMQNVYFDAFGSGFQWQNVVAVNPALTGSLMIRPVVGEGEPEASASVEELNTTQFEIFPNPTYGMVNVNIKNGRYDQFNYTIFDSVGKNLGSNILTNQLNFGDFQNGIYFLRIVNNKTQEVFNHKIVLVK